MIYFKQILSFPSIFKDRNDNIKKLIIFLTEINKDSDNNIIIKSSCNNHNQIIKFYDDNFNSKTKVQIYCSCESFKYEFSYVLFENDGLLNGNFFQKNFKPKIKNPYNYICGCKHIISLSQYVIKKLETINRRLK